MKKEIFVSNNAQTRHVISTEPNKNVYDVFLKSIRVLEEVEWTLEELKAYELYHPSPDYKIICKS